MKKIKLNAVLASVLSFGVVGGNSVFATAEIASISQLPEEAVVIIESPEHETQMLDSDESEDSTDATRPGAFVVKNKPHFKKQSATECSSQELEASTDMTTVDPIRSSSAENGNKIDVYCGRIGDINPSMKKFLIAYGGILDALLDALDSVDLSEKIPRKPVEFAKLLFNEDSRKEFLECLKSEFSRFSKAPKNYYEAAIMFKIYRLSMETRFTKN